MMQFFKKYCDRILLFANIAIRLLFVLFPFENYELIKFCRHVAKN